MNSDDPRHEFVSGIMFNPPPEITTPEEAAALAHLIRDRRILRLRSVA